ncbi:MAG: glycoside hydrolase family 31 protein [Dehalococcoidia bacterium]|jgi:alpha-D-xyloside xylohydrolase|nr:glycoside hydrolase family 31 protein [Chloroflexota bacterium]MCK4242000.1 glycoside hydrolase family 31 protein [Dehalococcoidia bacterium]
MKGFRKENDALVWEMNHETVLIQPWGKDSLRVRATKCPRIVDVAGALLGPLASEPHIEIHDKGAFIQSGKIKGEISRHGRIRFLKSLDNTVLLEEAIIRYGPTRHASRYYKSLSSDLFRLEATFNAYEGERLYGLGQHQHGFLDQKGCVVELSQQNTEVCIPFLLSSRGYGLLWNNPAVGRVELGRNRTRWIAEAAHQIDYVIATGDSFFDIMERYADATGHAPMLPKWASGFWQCKLRYKTQEELMSVAREYKRRGLPISVIVVDFLHWTLQGEWRFDPTCWPDPAAMVRELEEMNIKLMVSIWPTVNENSANFREMKEQGLLVRTERGVLATHSFFDNKPEGPVYLHLYDPTNPEARRFLWEQVRENYYRYGIKVWWLDACEPELDDAGDHDNLRYHIGNGLEVSCIYPLMHQQAFYEGMKSEGESEIVSLSRSAWAGSQRYGAAVWSGDIDSSFEALRTQVRAGLNIGLSGIPWWTTDIGGFLGSDPSTAYFRELIVRWFQYGAFCPLFRLHGFRGPLTPGPFHEVTGAPNEVWSFGDETYEIIKEILFLRERLTPYVMEQMRLAHEKGIPPMRPLFFDFPADEGCVSVDDEFLFGSDILVAPVLHYEARKRGVYLPAGTNWTDAWTDEKIDGGQWIEAEAPLERIPLYLRKDRHLPIRSR